MSCEATIRSLGTANYLHAEKLASGLSSYLKTYNLRVRVLREANLDRPGNCYFVVRMDGVDYNDRYTDEKRKLVRRYLEGFGI
jgi:hypothetical protein